MTTEPDDLPPLDLATEIRGMRQDFRQGFLRIERERIGRRMTNRLAALVIVGVLVVAAAVGVSYVNQGRITCAQRAESRSDTRAAIAIAIDEGARALDASNDERTALGERVAAAVLRELPPPDC